MFSFTRYQLIAACIVVGMALLGTVVLVAKSGMYGSSGAGEIEFFEPGENPNGSGSAESDEQAVAEPETMTIHVAGKVSTPGVCHLDPGSRVADAIEAAGGAAANADLDSINLAEKLSDGQQVYIAGKGEVALPAKSVVRGGAAQPASTGKPAGSSGTAKLTVPGQGTVNVNTAGLGELQRLPGIGPAYAQRIIDYRTEHGPFRSVDELIEVRGIGPKTLEKLRPFVTL